MKKLIVIGCLGCMACGEMRSDPVRGFIPGMYVRQFEHEFARGSDTLFLRLESQNNYTIIKRSGFERLKNGAWQEKEYRQELWQGVYHPEDGMMEEFKRGKVLEFRPREKKLLLGTSEYMKVK